MEITEIADMRLWLADSTWADMTDGEIEDLTDEEVIAAVQQHYTGGVAQFRADSRDVD